MQMNLKREFSIEGDVIPMSFIINNGDQDPAILINGFGEGYGDTGDHFAVTDEGKVIYTTVQEGYKEGIEWLHKLVTEDLIDPEAFTQEWSTYVAKGKNHRYGLCFTWDIANIDNNGRLCYAAGFDRTEWNEKYHKTEQQRNKWI